MLSGNYVIFIISYWKDNRIVPKNIIIIIIITIMITIILTIIMTIIIIIRRRRRRRTLKDTFQDIGLYWGLDKYCIVNVVRGNIVQSTNVNLNNDERLKTLHKNDKNKFLGKVENSTQLYDIVCEEVSEEFLTRLTVIWPSNISIQRKIKASNTFALQVI